MRIHSIASSLLVATWCAASLTACSGADPEPSASQQSTGTIRLMLTSQDGVSDLTLSGTPKDPSYVAFYPNPDRLTQLEFVLSSDGVPTTRCARGDIVVRCGETPFFTEVSLGSSDGVSSPPITNGATSTGAGGAGGAGGAAGETGGGGAGDKKGSAGAGGGTTKGGADGDSEDGDKKAGEASGASKPSPSAGTATGSSGGGHGRGRVIHVFDLHGREICEQPIANDGVSGTGGGSTGGGSAGGGSTGGSTCGGTAVGGAPGNGGFSKNGTSDACQAASMPDAPGCDGATVGAAATVYCNAVNAQLSASEKIDCSVLTNGAYAPSALPTTRSGGDCSTYWEPARSAVDAKGYTTCDKVRLLLTQWRDRSRHELIAHGACTSSPLVLDLDGDGIRLSNVDDGVAFDLLGTGDKVRSAWTDGRDGLLALDRNGNGAIDGAAELFGNATSGAVYPDGFAALTELDANGDGSLDARDAAFDHLVVWIDRNRDGVSAPMELSTLREAGVRRLSVAPTRREGPSSIDQHGNRLPLAAEFERRDGSRGVVVDAFLRFSP